MPDPESVGTIASIDTAPSEIAGDIPEGRCGLGAEAAMYGSVPPKD
jgi:hypothetical protein